MRIHGDAWESGGLTWCPWPELHLTRTLQSVLIRSCCADSHGSVKIVASPQPSVVPSGRPSAKRRAPLASTTKTS